VVRKLGEVSAFPTNPELIYRFHIICYFESLENPGWFEFWDSDVHYTKDSKEADPRTGKPKHLKGELKHRKGERKATTRYKRIDYDNRIKFLQDCVSSLVGIPDDSQIFVGYQEKRQDPTNPRAEVTITVESDVARFFPL
jgi:hypothetical protein